ncbi:MAG: hypothetical protein MPK31_02470 [Gammaproteobacteria bacterium]|nr:hypothetical protein [Gammaproteobacteria bacterium]MDA8014768.1 hypothetical protein [Gammaproteobacteria bacterium]
MKKVLLDTNVVIYREAGKAVRDDIGLLFRWLDKLRYEKCVHQVTVSEIHHHEDPVVKKTMLVKLASYVQLQTVAPTDCAIEKILEGDTTERDRNDTMLLNEVHAGRVECMITEDKEIHKKAELLQLQGRVFRIEEFLNKAVTENPQLTAYKTLSVRNVLCGKLRIQDPFFASFKEDYGHDLFTNWFNKKANETVYASMDDAGQVVAFLYLKIEQEDEDYSDIEPRFSKKKRLKIGTLKVVSTGHKLGERFLRIVFDNALKNHVEEIYVTLFENREENMSLVHLLTTWGFVRHGEKITASGQEAVYVRDFRPQLRDSIKECYPFISGKQRKFLVPIYPKYHTELLPDSILNTEKRENFLASKGHRNSIQKVYICRSINKDISPKDIIVFYRTGGYYAGVVTTIGVVDSVVQDIRVPEKFIELCRKRSVFSDAELLEHWDYKPRSRPFITNFLYVYSLPSRPNLAKLIEHGVIADVESAPRGFTPLTDNQFNTILEISNANKDFIVDQT